MPETLTRKETTFSSRIALAVIGEKGAMHFWIDSYKEDSGLVRFYGGIEQHSRTPTYDKPPDHETCWLLNAPCWHDGSSLQAEETWIPLYQSCVECHAIERFWNRLESAYYEMFEEV